MATATRTHQRTAFLRLTKPLRDWLERVNAHCQWSQHLPGEADSFSVECWLVRSRRDGKARPMLLQIWDSGTWEVFRPAHDGTEVGMTLDEAAIFFGVDGCAGLVPDEEVVTPEQLANVGRAP